MSDINPELKTTTKPDTAGLFPIANPLRKAGVQRGQVVQNNHRIIPLR